ncbi:MAG TPA: hypothetical protein VM243_01460, partial [Phycisphaerae bacterium]|nr:hypothetical protein [Phycisphaerae bacterium]
MSPLDAKKRRPQLAEIPELPDLYARGPDEPLLAALKAIGFNMQTALPGQAGPTGYSGPTSSLDATTTPLAQPAALPPLSPEERRDRAAKEDVTLGKLTTGSVHASVKEFAKAIE